MPNESARPRIEVYHNLLSPGSPGELGYQALHHWGKSGMVDGVILSLCRPERELHKKPSFATSLSIIQSYGMDCTVEWWLWPEAPNQIDWSSVWFEERLGPLKDLCASFPFVNHWGVDTEPYSYPDRDIVLKRDRSELKTLMGQVHTKADIVFPVASADPENCYDVYGQLGEKWYTEKTYYHWHGPQHLKHHHDVRGYFMWPYQGPQHPNNGRHKFWRAQDLFGEEPWRWGPNPVDAIWIYSGHHPHIVARHFRDFIDMQGIGFLTRGIQAKSQGLFDSAAVSWNS